MAPPASGDPTTTSSAGVIPTTAAAATATATSDAIPAAKVFKRWDPNNTKVYTRKIRRLKTPKPSSSPVPEPACADVIVPSDPPPPSPPPPPPPPPPPAVSVVDESGGGAKLLRINLRSATKSQIRQLRSQLTDELGQIRACAQQIGAQYGGADEAIADDNVAADEAIADDDDVAADDAVAGEDVTADVIATTAPVVEVTAHTQSQHSEFNGFRHLTVETNFVPAVTTSGGFGFERENRLNGGFGFDRENRADRGFAFERENRTNGGFSLDRGRLHGGFSFQRENRFSMSMEREKRTPKANQYYKNPDFLLLGRGNRFPPLESSNSFKKLKRPKYSQAFKGCANLLSRLMKHKFGWVFNAPVDVKGLGLHDYYSIITHPMDLGTVKTRLNKNWYKSPGEFAEDVRLTFRNAMIYNPKGQDVHIMAEQLSQLFEERWVSIEAEYSYVPCTPTPVSRKNNGMGDGRMLDRSDSMVYQMGVVERRMPTSSGHVVRSSVLKQPKPKAKDLYKREMTFEEKQKLGSQLQSLPPEKLDGVVQIIRRRNSGLCQQEDEIEVDIDCVDTETLWELDRFVTNYKKSLSKHKRKAELAMLAKADAERKRAQERVMEVEVVGEPIRENHTVMAEKDVGSSLPIQGDNRMESASGSSSSSSSGSDSSSSSSGSDSDSSSANESDAGH